MAIPVQISYRDMQHSEALDQLIMRELSKLERYYDRISGARVLVEHAYRRSGAPFHARIILNVPGEDIFINREEAGAEGAFKDAVLAIRSAFRKAKRQLQEYVRVRA
ncbi:MAG TPA: HPF/RaiA family ribosome-associated protein [Candidatus Baltobacteraceae bacterium]|jgi:ribosome-associated translation inhibitor RaiA|nr:HPF/RaiA family ribosome-associated protein [Candidatus Baltobacteraceae bacterium]